MELAAAALTAVTSAVSTVGTAVTGAVGATGGATGLGSLFGGGSLFSSILQGGATVASVVGALGAGDEQGRTLDLRASDSIEESRLEGTRGIERRDGLRKSLLERFGQQDVAAAASGVDLSFGTPAIAREEAARDAERALSSDQSTQDQRVSRLQERADEFSRGAKAARKAGVLKAFGAGITGLASITKRG